MNSFIFIAPGPPRLASATCGARSVITVTCKNGTKLSCLSFWFNFLACHYLNALAPLLRISFKHQLIKENYTLRLLTFIYTINSQRKLFLNLNIKTAAKLFVPGNIVGTFCDFVVLSFVDQFTAECFCSSLQKIRKINKKPFSRTFKLQLPWSYIWSC